MKKMTPKDARKISVLTFVALSAGSLTGCSLPASAGILFRKPAEFIPALIAFLVIWFGLAKFAWPMIMDTLDKRQEKIQGDLDAAEHAKDEALREKQAYKKRLDNAEREVGEIISAAKKDAEQERAEVLAKAQRDAADVVAKSHELLETERRKAMIELSGSVVDLSVDIAGKIIGNELTEQQQRELAEKYLNEVGQPDDEV
jgi:F-type H+-transporting ATPase subunit b